MEEMIDCSSVSNTLTDDHKDKITPLSQQHKVWLQKVSQANMAALGFCGSTEE